MAAAEEETVTIDLHIKEEDDDEPMIGEEEVVEPVATATVAIQWEKMTATQLKCALTDRGLDTSGKKSQLVERLVKYEEEKTSRFGTRCLYLDVYYG